MSSQFSKADCPCFKTAKNIVSGLWKMNFCPETLFHKFWYMCNASCYFCNTTCLFLNILLSNIVSNFSLVQECCLCWGKYWHLLYVSKCVYYPKSENHKLFFSVHLCFFLQRKFCYYPKMDKALCTRKALSLKILYLRKERTPEYLR